MSIAIAVLVAKLIGWSLMQGIVIGATVSVASTMVLARLLADRGAMSSSYGRVMIGITLVEDFAVVLMTVVLPSFASSDQDKYVKAAWTLGKALLLLIPLVFVAMKVVPVVLRRAKGTQNEELMLMIAIAIALGTAALAEAIGLSMALGAFLAGLAISGAKDLHDVHDRLIPLRDAFVALFFVSLGALIQPEVIRRNLPLLGVMLALILPGKFLIWMVVVRLFGYPSRDAVAAAVGLTQIGELSFVVVTTAATAGLVGENIFNAAVAASLISIFLNVFAVRGVLGYVERKWPHAVTQS
jgi:CPA2 family monovalent cation:H+ antiporter-2